MNRILLAILPIFALTASAAPVAIQVSHSGYLLGASEAPIDATSQPMTFTFVDGNGATVWTASCSVPVKQGYYAVTLGAPGCGPALNTGHLPAGAVRELSISVGATALLPRLAVVSAPTAGLAQEALHAADADSLGGIAAADYLVRTGDGSGLTSLDASALTTGTVPAARLAAIPDSALASNGDLAKLSGAQSFTGLKTFAPAGTVPFSIGGGLTSVVANLNADRVDGVSLPSGAVTCPPSEVATGLTVGSGTLGVSCQAVAAPSTTATGVQAFASGAQPACLLGNAGALYFDTTTHQFMACDGQAGWRALGTAPAMTATGGTITTTGGFRYHTFLASGTFQVTANPSQIEALLVGGGGGGGNPGSYFSGGGGGGAVVVLTGRQLAVQSYAVTVGNGGGAGADGFATTFLSETAPGGGRGGRAGDVGNGANGGGGGGSGSGNTTTPPGVGVAPTLTGSGVVFAGRTGGLGLGSIVAAYGGGGGGAGAGANGGAFVDGSNGGDGGAGAQVNFGLHNHYWGGGGGGCAHSEPRTGHGGLGGGGAAGADNATAYGTGGGSALATGGGTTGGNAGAGGTNTGGGGGGACYDHGGGGAGGSGIVVIRYAYP